MAFITTLTWNSHYLEIVGNNCILYIATLTWNFLQTRHICKLLHCIYCNNEMQFFFSKLDIFVNYCNACIARLTCKFSQTGNIVKLLHCVHCNTDMQLFQNLKYLKITAMRILQHWHVTFPKLEITACRKLQHWYATFPNPEISGYCYIAEIYGNFGIAFIATLTCNFSQPWNIWILLHCVCWNTDMHLFPNL